jgi:hypothetical protein
MTGGFRRASALALAIAAAIALTAVHAERARADDTAEAAALFASGNAHLQSSQRLRGARRTRELEAALSDYVASLRIVRSRNVLFNASLALEGLERNEDAFNYLIEYLAVTGLSDTERAEGTRRLDALRPRVAVLSIDSTPPDAEVWIDRRDLASRGRTPLLYAIAAGEHRLWLRAPGHAEADARATATTGETTPLSVTLEADPVSLQVLAPAEPRLTLDGEPIAAGAHVDIAPGIHVVRLEIEGIPAIERRFEVLPGAAPMVIDLAPAAAGLARRAEATLVMVADHPARVMLDGLLVGGGGTVEAPVSVGEHEIRVEAEGRAPFVTRRTFAVGERAELHVELAELGGGALDGPRIVFGVLTGVGALAVLGTTVSAVFALEDYDVCIAENRLDCHALADQSEAWGIAAYTAMGIAGALAIVELALLIADDSGSAESAGSFVLAPVPTDSGFVLAAGGRL